MRVIYLIQFQKFHPSRAERVILFFRQALRHLKAIVGNQLGFLYNLVGPAMNPLDIDIDACMDAFMDACVAKLVVTLRAGTSPLPKKNINGS